MGIVCYLLFIFWLIMLVRIILSWFPRLNPGPLRVVVDLIYAVTDPPLRLVRGLLPPVRMGSIGMDFSPLIIFVVILVLRGAIC